MNGAKTPKTMRLSAEIIALIEKEKGETFTEKFETLVVHRYQDKMKLDLEIAGEIKRLKELKAKIQKYSQVENTLRSINNYVSFAVNMTVNNPIGSGD